MPICANRRPKRNCDPRINLPMIRFSPTGFKPQDLLDKIALVINLKTAKEGVVDD